MWLTKLFSFLWMCPSIVMSLVTYWSVVPPSTNPSSSLNQNLLQELLEYREGIIYHKVDDGRIWVEVDDPFVLKKLDARSVRLVVFQVSNLTENDTSSTIVEYLTLTDDWKNRLHIAIHDQWIAMGNILPEDCDTLTFCIKCQKWSDFVNPYQSTSSVSNDVSVALTTAFGWQRVKKNQEPTFLFHILLHANMASVELVTLVRPIPIEELPKPGFKRVESYILARGANIQPNNIVLDPMCGRATFLIEAATFWPEATYIGVDASEEQLGHARLNCQATKLVHNIQLYTGTATQLNFIQDSSIDRILCCPPFGRQFDKDSTNVYSELLVEWSRVLTQNGTMVLLIDMDNVHELTLAIVQSGCKVMFQHSPFRLGRIRATILVVVKKSGMWKDTHMETGLFDWEDNNKWKGRSGWTFLRSQALPKLSPVRPGHSQA